MQSNQDQTPVAPAEADRTAALEVACQALATVLSQLREEEIDPFFQRAITIAVAMQQNSVPQGATLN